MITESNEFEVPELADAWDELLAAVSEWSTSSYVYSPHIMLTRWRRLRAVFGSNVEVLASVKANPHATLLEKLMLDDAAFDVSSSRELRMVKRISNKLGRSPFTPLVGPGKAPQLLRDAVRSSIDEIALESEREWEHLVP